MKRIIFLLGFITCSFLALSQGVIISYPSASGGTTPLPSLIFGQWTGTNNQGLTNTPNTILLANPLPLPAMQNTPEFTNVGGVVTYTGTTQNFLIKFAITAQANTTQRSTDIFKLYINGNPLPFTAYDSRSYHRIANDGYMTVERSCYIVLNNGDTIQAMGQERTNADNISIIRNESTLSILLIR